ncbi:NUDIX hydrolase N-terminal domain-containing protein [Cesiribacter sp. SM1]|uniref:NUDIX hydrolase n=1 Tax=Cesiribacter sp. SM1 TaxID=2861196 RepID=UPI001CD2D5E1|nr:NUDIX hydrolase [Cesiribacter sp. SM1]
MTTNEVLNDIKRLKTLADTGLLYATNEYDRDRYIELQDISYRLLSNLSGSTEEELRASFAPVKEYPTPKVDVRGLVIRGDGKILMVKESADGKWALPGGWADIGYSPKESIIKECKEEAGIDVVPERLLAVYDKKMHPHPPEQYYIYKIAILCRATSFELNKGFDVLDVGYFDISNLPELSEDRNLKSQIEMLYQKALSSDTEAYCD